VLRRASCRRWTTALYFFSPAVREERTHTAAARDRVVLTSRYRLRVAPPSHTNAATRKLQYCYTSFALPARSSEHRQRLADGIRRKTWRQPLDTAAAVGCVHAVYCLFPLHIFCSRLLPGKLSLPPALPLAITTISRTCFSANSSPAARAGGHNKASLCRATLFSPYLCVVGTGLGI